MTLEKDSDQAIEYNRDGKRWVLTAEHTADNSDNRDADASDIALALQENPKVLGAVGITIMVSGMQKKDVELERLIGGLQAELDAEQTKANDLGRQHTRQAHDGALYAKGKAFAYEVAIARGTKLLLERYPQDSRDRAQVAEDRTTTPVEPATSGVSTEAQGSAGCGGEVCPECGAAYRARPHGGDLCTNDWHWHGVSPTEPEATGDARMCGQCLQTGTHKLDCSWRDRLPLGPTKPEQQPAGSIESITTENAYLYQADMALADGDQHGALTNLLKHLRQQGQVLTLTKLTHALRSVSTKQVEQPEGPAVHGPPAYALSLLADTLQKGPR